MNRLLIFILVFFFMLVIDFLWIKSFMQKEYENGVGSYLRKEKGELKVLFFPAILTYLIMAFGFVYFLGLSNLSLTKTIVSGALLGFLIYSTFAFTNYSILKIWTLKLAILDTIWGAVLGILTSGFIVSLRSI